MKLGNEIKKKVHKAQDRKILQLFKNHPQPQNWVKILMVLLSNFLYFLLILLFLCLLAFVKLKFRSILQKQYFEPKDKLLKLSRFGYFVFLKENPKFGRFKTYLKRWRFGEWLNSPILVQFGGIYVEILAKKGYK